MKIALGKFVCFCIDARLGEDLATGVQSALGHYKRRLRSGWAPVQFPDFCRDFEPEGSTAELELPVDCEVRAMLGREARKHGTSVDQIATHAVFVYLADLESGSVPAIYGRS